ncbi:MAG: Ldh family oxidoreductase [Roseicyclus sp.]|jgi:(2R)-3-sulfolactate dehydrogenase (NADP+)
MTQRLSLADLRALAQDCLTRAGVPEAAAAAVAAEVAASEAASERHFGMEALLRDLRLIRYGRLKPDARSHLQLPRPALMRVDAAHGLAAAALSDMAPRLAELARTQGVALLQLEQASNPGLMISAVSALAQAGLSAVAYGVDGAGRFAHPDLPGSAPMRHPPDDALAVLLAGRGQPADSPIGGMVAHGAWLLAADPAVAGDAVLRSAAQDYLPAPQPAHEIALTSELLEQIVTA